MLPFTKKSKRKLFALMGDTNLNHKKKRNSNNIFFAMFYIITPLLHKKKKVTTNVYNATILYL